MRLNHLDLATGDLAATRDFFVAHLGFVCLTTLGRDGLAILRDESGFVLVLSHLRRAGAQGYPEGFHVGFLLDSDDEVEALHARLEAAGTAVGAPGVQRGAFAFYFVAPGGILTEIAHRP